jgi:hypothetical protein
MRVDWKIDVVMHTYLYTPANRFILTDCPTGCLRQQNLLLRCYKYSAKFCSGAWGNRWSIYSDCCGSSSDSSNRCVAKVRYAVELQDLQQS